MFFNNLFYKYGLCLFIEHYMNYLKNMTQGKFSVQPNMCMKDILFDDLLKSANKTSMN